MIRITDMLNQGTLKHTRVLPDEISFYLIQIKIKSKNSHIVHISDEVDYYLIQIKIKSKNSHIVHISDEVDYYLIQIKIYTRWRRKLPMLFPFQV